MSLIRNIECYPSLMTSVQGKFGHSEHFAQLLVYIHDAKKCEFSKTKFYVQILHMVFFLLLCNFLHNLWHEGCKWALFIISYECIYYKLIFYHCDAPGRRWQKNNYGSGDEMLQIVASSYKSGSRRHYCIVYTVPVNEWWVFISSQPSPRIGRFLHPTSFLTCPSHVCFTWGPGGARSLLHKPP